MASDGGELRRTLEWIDGRGFKAYRDIRGAFAFGALTLHVDHVQGDPFAAPSRLRVRLSQDAARLPAELFDTPVRRTALADYLARRVARVIGQESTAHRGSGRSGVITIDAGGQEVLERTAVVVHPHYVEARLQVGLPAAGRRVRGSQAIALLCEELPRIGERALGWQSIPQAEARAFVACVENQEHIRSQLEGAGLVAFVGNGSVLPRESGASDRPLASDVAVPFEAPPSLEVELELAQPRDGETRLRGLGIPRGVTLVVGGGYHGKSTLLRALERCVYPHVPGDGRETVVSAPDLVKIRAEDGRRVEQVDIGAFIGELPSGRSTRSFSSDDASGSTSQAANIVEAIEAGASGLLLDEDTSATNFMVRDARMQTLIHKADEPITPFVERVRELYERLGVSTVLVMGGCGDYFEVADTVIALRGFRPSDATAAARRIADEQDPGRRREAPAPLERVTERVPLSGSFDASRGSRSVKIDAHDLDLVRYGTSNIDLRCVEQLVDPSQTRAVGHAIHFAAARFVNGKASLRQVVDRIERRFDERGLDELDPFHRPDRHPGNFARPRRFEIAAAINRLRTLRMRQRREEPC